MLLVQIENGECGVRKGGWKRKERAKLEKKSIKISNCVGSVQTCLRVNHTTNDVMLLLECNVNLPEWSSAALVTFEHSICLIPVDMARLIKEPLEAI